MPRNPKKTKWWEEPTPPRKPDRDEIEEADVKAVIAELPQDCDAAKAYRAGADTVVLSHLLSRERPDLLQRLLTAMDKGRERHWERAKPLLASCGHRAAPRR
jgi:hypothetical protein